MIKAYRSITDVAGYTKDQLVLLDDDNQDQAGLVRSGYFEQLPETPDGAQEPYQAG